MLFAGVVEPRWCLTSIRIFERTQWARPAMGTKYRDADEPQSGERNQQHSGLADDGGLKTALL
jgi:hypothetical protein